MTRWPQRSPLQVTLSDLTSSCVFRSLTWCQRHTSDPNSLKLAVYGKDIGVCNLYISDFWYRWPKVMSISWPPHYKSMVKKLSTSKLIRVGRWWQKVVLTRAAESTKFQRLRLRLRLGKIDSDFNSDSSSDSDPHQSLFLHVEEQYFKTVVSPLQCLWCKILLAN